jgi:hypothetical protein
MKRRNFVKSIAGGITGVALAPSILSCNSKNIAFIDRLLPAPVGGGFSMEDYWVWGSSVIKGEDGRYHMFASRWLKTLGFDKWVSNSEVVRAVSDTPEGPYSFEEVVLPVRGKQYFDGLVTHNPRIVKYKDTYLLYYFGTTYDFPVPRDAHISMDVHTADGRLAWMNKRIGLAVSKSVYGPWTRMDRPVIEPRPGMWDASITSNPAPVVNPKTGEILLMYKSSSKGPEPPLLLGVSKADNHKGPYKRLSDSPIFRFETEDNQANDVEDPYVWWAGNRYEVIMKDRFGYICGEEGGGIHAWSRNGVKWKLFKNVKAYSRTIKWDDGTVTFQNHFERPFLLIEDGVPTHLFAATGTGLKSWEFDRTWNMVIPLK